MKKIIGLVVMVAMVLGMVCPAAANALPVTEKTDRFTVLNEDDGLTMVSEDNELVIHINDDVEIIFEDGTDARERLEANQTLAELLDTRNLVVSYTKATFSLPPQTTPEKIVIMYETAVPLPIDVEGGAAVTPVTPIYEFTPEEIEELFPLNGEIVICDEIADAPAPYYNNGVVMVPLRAVAEALGYDVIWNADEQSVNLGPALTLTIGSDYYIRGRMVPFELGTAPELTDGLTYVPLSFWQTVVGGLDAYVFEGQVVIAEAGDMQ